MPLSTLFPTLALLALVTTPVAAIDTAPILQLDTGGHMAKIQDVAFTADGTQLVSAGNDKIVRVWDLETGQTVRAIRGAIGPGREGMIYAMALSANDNWLAVAGWMQVQKTGAHGDIRLFDFHTGRLAAVLSGHPQVVFDLAFSPDGSLLASASADRTAIVWDLESRRALATLRGHTERITRIGFTHDGKRVVTASDDHTLRLWRARDGATIAVMPGHEAQVRALAVSPRSGLIASGGDDRTIRLWDDRDGHAIRVLAKQPTHVASLSFSPDGRRLVSGVGAGPDNDVHVWSVPDGAELLRYAGHDNIVVATDVGPNGRWAASGGGNRREIHVWALKDGGVQRVLGGIGDAIWTVAFSADASRLAWSKTHPCPTPDTCLAPAPLEFAMTLPDAQRPIRYPVALPSYAGFDYAQPNAGEWSLVPRATGTRGWPDVLDIYRAQTLVGSIARGATTGFRHNTFTFTPDRKSVISGGMNGELAHYDVGGTLLGQFRGHTGDVWSVAVSSDGRLLASGSADQTIRVWDITTHQGLMTLFHGRNEEWVAWTESGYYASSPRGDLHIGWHVNRRIDEAAEFFEATRFRKQRYRPPVLEETLITASESIALARLERGQSRPETMQELIAAAPSRPALIDPPRGVVTDRIQRYRIQLTEGTQRLLVNVNGRPTRADDTVVHEPLVEREVHLIPGKNLIQFVARNPSGDSKTLRATITYKPPAAGTIVEDWRKPVLYVLSIGVARYADPNLNLRYPDDDVQALAERLRAEKGGIYRDVRVKTLLNEEATRGAILDALAFLEQMTQDDLALLFIAGHGKLDDRGEFFFLPQDVDTSRLRSTGVKWVEFKDLVSGLPGKVLLLVDACHSAAIFGGKGRRAVLDMNQLATEFADAEAGAIVFTSSQGKEFSQESEIWGHGAFTKVLLDGLGGAADQNGDGIIHQEELELHVKRGVVDLTQGAQHPILLRPDPVPDFPLALVAQARG